jgi:hypothetical protein
MRSKALKNEVKRRSDRFCYVALSLVSTIYEKSDLILRQVAIDETDVYLHYELLIRLVKTADEKALAFLPQLTSSRTVFSASCSLLSCITRLSDS